MDYSPGLRGVVAGETAISTVGKEGTSPLYLREVPSLPTVEIAVSPATTPLNPGE